MKWEKGGYMKNSSNITTLKELAKQAKRRLMYNNYDNYKSNKMLSLEMPTFYLNCKVVSQDEMYRYYEQVVDILNSDDIITNPLGRLTDYEYYKSLDEGARARYIYGISSIYIYLKERYNKEKKAKKLYY